MTMGRENVKDKASGKAVVPLIALAVWALSFAWTAAQSVELPAQLSEKVFKNVQVLKGIPVDEFMDVMGMFAAALGYDCTSCHAPEVLENRAAFAVATPQIQRARGMIAMMNTLNRTYFNGQPRVSCFTCHRGHDRPEVVPNLALQYGDVTDDPNAMQFDPDRQATAQQLFDKYLQALGGAARLAALTSLTAKGTYTGFNTGGGEVPIEILARAPDHRATLVRAPDGDSVTVFNGRDGWVAEGWRPLPLMALTGGNLAGARIDALMSFPSRVPAAFSRWQVGNTTIDNRRADIVQGSNDGQLPVNFYFDDAGLLIRLVRWNRTAAGTVPTQIDYADYRDVNGIKFPFRINVTWTDGQNTIQLSEVQPNAPVDASRFTRPAPFRRR